MAISDIAQTAPNPTKKGPDCTVCRALAELPPADAAGLLKMLKDPDWRYTAIEARISADEDSPEWVRAIDDRTYARHATRGCAARVKLR